LNKQKKGKYKLDDVNKAATESFKMSRDLINQVLSNLSTPTEYQKSDLKELAKTAVMNSLNISNFIKNHKNNINVKISYSLQPSKDIVINFS